MRRAIERKRAGEALSATEWGSVIGAYMDGKVDDAQMAAMAMACVWRGLSMDEIVALTQAMVNSGRRLNYGGNGIVVDKHSSGGVSDIVSLVAVPLVASCGVRVAKLSGRALGHTGGTIDKLETTPGFNVALPLDRFVRQVEAVGCAIAAQTEEVVPADKRLYKLRDHTGTIPAVGLIASSIVSKKIAGGAHAIVFDVKCGSAAFMHDAEQAQHLAQTLVDVAQRFDRRARALVTDMNEPLGRSIGTALEVIEARDVLRGEVSDERITEACVHVASHMLELGGVKDAEKTASRALRSGAGYRKFTEMIEAQGSSRAALEAMTPHGDRHAITAATGGFVEKIDAVSLGNAARHLTHRDSSAGIRVAVRTGDHVEAGALLAEIFGNETHTIHEHVAAAFTISPTPPPSRPLIYSTSS